MMGKLVTFPKVMSGSVKCPTCQKGVQGMMVYPRAKYLLPCQHQITPVQETQVVLDMYRRGL